MKAWAALAGAAAPALRWHLRRRAAAGKEDAARLPEREGFGAARPAGPVIWLHAASVGEALAVLPLADALLAAAPELHVLLTTGTVTSAVLLRERWPALDSGRATHRFAPLDVPAWVGRFLDGWRPDAAAFVESEIWPNTLAALAARGVPAALVNGRLSPRSFARWRRWAPGPARRLLGGFARVLPRSAEDAARFAALGARVEPPADLKRAAPPLPADAAALAALRAAAGGRPVWLAASTHPGEDEQVVAAARAAAVPGLLTVIVPRHPQRGAAVAALCGGAGRRSQGALPDAGPFHVADTIGELGLFYRLAGAAFIGGSLVPHGGQNPLEAARLGCPALMGPHRFNFTEAAAELEAAGALRPVAGADALARAVRDVLTVPQAALEMRRAAAGFAQAAEEIPHRLAARLLEMLRG
ncbi:3-deoxy-D-manno-octulosonic acid transferase [Roseococcus sp. DSY-14]|uniref:3-deoxy-D-manno-octulosonic acid transferase n=1 Tax=Roseococcus sp. DSY-14 TaxID=3369650 RepID=UPI00387ABCD6